MTNIFPLLQASGNASATGSGAFTWIFILAIIVIFYVFMILPQRKKQKQVEEFRKSLEKVTKSRPSAVFMVKSWM